MDAAVVVPSPKIVERDYPGVVLLRQRTNLGFAAGANVGIHHALAYDEPVTRRAT